MAGERHHLDKQSRSNEQNTSAPEEPSGHANGLHLSSAKQT
jgi:hypothetical protein